MFEAIRSKGFQIMALHHAEAIPLDLLKQEQDRIASEMAKIRAKMMKSQGNVLSRLKLQQVWNRRGSFSVLEIRKVIGIYRDVVVRLGLKPDLLHESLAVR